MPAFWARRARRILPPALFVLLFCAVATIGPYLLRAVDGLDMLS